MTPPLTRSSPTLETFLDPNFDTATLAKSKDAMVHMFKLLQQLIIQNKAAVVTQGKKIEELETTVVKHEERIAALEERLVRSEQYSSRGTAIITGLKETTGENLEEEVAKIVNEVGVLPGSFTAKDISHVHRNKRKADSDKPRSITLVFARSIDKDRLFRKSVKDKLFEKNKIKLHHHMCYALIQEQRKMEEVAGVKWVNYMGHSSGFSVKMEDGAYFKRMSHTADLQKMLVAPRT